MLSHCDLKGFSEVLGKDSDVPVPIILVWVQITCQVELDGANKMSYMVFRKKDFDCLKLLCIVFCPPVDFKLSKVN